MLLGHHLTASAEVPPQQEALFLQPQFAPHEQSGPHLQSLASQVLQQALLQAQSAVAAAAAAAAPEIQAPDNRPIGLIP